MSRHTRAPILVTGHVSLLATLQHAHFRVATIVMLAVGFALTLAALVALRSAADHNLQLVARSIAYTTEAAVVFRDTIAIQESLGLIARQESLAGAQIVDTHGTLLGRYIRPTDSWPDAIGDRIVALLLPQPTITPVMYQGQRIAEVRLRGDGAGFMGFMGFMGFIFMGLAGMLVCLALGAVAVRQLSRRIQRDILQPVLALTAVTYAARFDRSTSARAPASNITEFHQLGEDFNALLMEIELYQTQLHQENKSLSHLANHDSLTGLPNRAYFRRRLTRVLQDIQTTGGSLAVLYLDNDHFKSINDRYGHAVGDALLVEVADRVRAQVRENDVVARLGGDEFAILLAPLHNVEDAARIADKIIASMAVPLDTRPQDHIVPSLSIGIAIYPIHGQTAEQLLRAADRAMYRVKSQQRGQRHIFNVHTDQHDGADSLHPVDKREVL